MKQLVRGAYIVAGMLLVTACTITPAQPNATSGATGETGTATATAVETTPAGTTEAGTTGSMTDTAGAGATTAVTDTATTGGAAGVTGTVTDTSAAAVVSTTTTVTTTTITTVTDEAAGTGTADAGSGLPTPTPAAAGATGALTASAPVSTPVNAAATATGTVTETGAVAATLVTSTVNFTGTIADYLATTPELATLANAINATGMLPAVQQPGPVTIFAPTNDAFAAIPEDQLNALLADPGTLAGILQYHVVIDNVSSDRLAALGAAISTSGLPLTVTVQTDGSLLVNDARVLQPDVVATNGVIHLIDKVLTPPAGATGQP